MGGLNNNNGITVIKVAKKISEKTIDEMQNLAATYRGAMLARGYCVDGIIIEM